MQSFSLHIPTRLFFGSDQGPAFAREAASLGRHAFVVTGGGSVSRAGYLDQATSALTTAGVTTTLFTGIEPNPESATINRATAALRAAGADFVVAVGGGSVIDAAKAIAALARTDEPDVWPFVLGQPRAGQLKEALPLAAVPTTAATASEVTAASVISNRIAVGKSLLAAEFLRPRVSWLNPAFTASLPAVVTQDGAADILSHVFENYLLGGSESPLADRYSEAIILTVIDTLPRLLATPADLALRGDLLWASSLALNGYQRAGRRTTKFVLHHIEHSLSAVRPELSHGRGLATLYPAYFRWLLDHDRARDRFALLGARIFDLTGSEEQKAQGFVETFERWLKANHLYQSLASLGFTDADFATVADYTVKTYGDGQKLEALGPLPIPEIIAILRQTNSQNG